MRHFLGLLVTCGIACVVQVGVIRGADSPPTKSPDNDPFASFIARHCQECHGVEKPKGDLRLDQLSRDFSQQSVREKWLHVAQRIDAGEMPPKSKPRPTKQDVQAISNWIRNRVRLAEAGGRAAQGRVVLRRLNRNEYENTVRDL